MARKTAIVRALCVLS